MPRHGALRLIGVAGAKGLDDGEMFARLLRQPAKVVAGFVVLPGHVAKGAEQRLQPANLVSEERVAARFGDQVVQLGIEIAGLRNERRTGIANRRHPPQVAGKTVELGQGNSTAGQARRLAFQHAAHLADFPDFLARHPADDGAAIGQAGR